MITIYLVKSDNFEYCWMTADAYREVTLQMSTGDYHTHRARAVEVTSQQLEDLKYHSEKHFVDFQSYTDDQLPCWFWYDGRGDCVVTEDHSA